MTQHRLAVAFDYRAMVKGRLPVTIEALL